MSKRHDSPLGKVPETWSLVHLKDVAEKVKSGATPRGGDSSYLPSRDRFALIRSQNVFDRRFDETGLAFISDEQAGELSGAEVQAGDALLNITGDGITFARSTLVPERVLPACVNQHVMLIRPRRDKCVSGFLLSYLTHPQIKDYIESFNAGGSRRAITKGHIESFVIPLPPLSEQRAIASVLGALDDKMELNRRMNETLEALARALFQNWFVDATQADLPNGWEVRGLDEIANFLNGLALQKFPPNGDDSLPVIKIAQLRAGHTESADRAATNLPSQYIIEDGDVLFSWSGSLEVEIWCGGRGALNQHLFKVTSAHFPKWFYYLWTRHHLADFQNTAANKATTMGHIQRHHLSEAKVFVPPPTLMETMNKQFAPVVEKLIANRLESRTLAALRDALLPKLLSGELRVPAAA